MPCVMGQTMMSLTVQCGSENCRGYVKGTDWSRPELWEKYDGYFMPYLARRIEAVKEKESVSTASYNITKQQNTDCRDECKINAIRVYV